MKGNLTIEASIIIPFIMIIFAFIIIASVLIYDLLTQWTYQSLIVDSYVIAGQDTLSMGGFEPIIMKEEGNELVSESFFKIDISSISDLYYNTKLFETELDSKLIIDDHYLKPKQLIRMVDFLDDASDMYTYTKEAKASYEETLENIKNQLNKE